MKKKTGVRTLILDQVLKKLFFNYKASCLTVYVMTHCVHNPFINGG